MGTSPELSIEQQQLLDLHLRLVLEENQISNLTRIDDLEQGRLLHIEDSLVGYPELVEAPSGRYGDMGTGGGFPGIPLAIVSGRETLLIDSVSKKTRALDRMIEKLGLADHVFTYTGRSEDLAKEQPSSFSALTARALSSLPSLIELASPLLVHGGVLICYKAQVDEAELEQSKALEKKLGMRLKSVRETNLSDNETKRSIIVFEKASEPSVSLPRRPGMAQKRPYRA